jgi:hypothetical protein
MATVQAVISRIDKHKDRDVWMVSWGPLTSANADGSAVEMPGAADRSVQLQGTFGPATVTLQGCNEATPVNWHALTDPQGNDIAKTASDLEAVSEVTRWVRPLATAGDGTTSVTVTLLMRKS